MNTTRASLRHRLLLAAGAVGLALTTGTAAGVVLAATGADADNPNCGAKPNDLLSNFYGTILGLSSSSNAGAGFSTDFSANGTGKATAAGTSYKFTWSRTSQGQIVLKFPGSRGPFETRYRLAPHCSGSSTQVYNLIGAGIKHDNQLVMSNHFANF
ncbi:hypothetical protein [Actinomadura oligospora]|uniref:hypothetical protein n=1 Tax=Actinomadura oligospora TaxID=111804 RepID=UPI00047B24D2|nr:hypothetical protein [Actinomadura oligospora]